MKTLFLAVSMMSSLWGQTAIPQRELDEDVLWGRVKRSVVTITSNGAPSGVGVLIDSKGWFLAHAGAMSGAVMTPGTIDNRIVTLRVLATDKETNLVLLEASGWRAEYGTPIRVSAAASQSGERILAATLDGPIWAELGAKDRVGNMLPSQRYAPLNELRLESGKARAQGALAFNERGELVGVLGATLAEAEMKTGARGGAGTANFGPGELSVAYAFGPKLLDRVVEGFRSPDHMVKHPSIGIYFKKSPQGGALIESIVVGGEAEKSGLKAGDVVVEVDGQVVAEAVGFATLLFSQSVGEEMFIKVRRGDEVLEFKVRVGYQTAEEAMASSSFQRTERSPRKSLNSGRNATSSKAPGE